MSTSQPWIDSQTMERISRVHLRDLLSTLGNTDLIYQGWRHLPFADSESEESGILTRCETIPSDSFQIMTSLLIGLLTSDAADRALPNMEVYAVAGEALLLEAQDDDTVLTSPLWDIARVTDKYQPFNEFYYLAVSRHQAAQGRTPVTDWSSYPAYEIASAANLLHIFVTQNLEGIRSYVDQKFPDHATVIWSLYDNEGLSLPDAVRAAQDVMAVPVA